MDKNEHTETENNTDAGGRLERIVMCDTCALDIIAYENGQSFPICEKLHWTDPNDMLHPDFKRKYDCGDYKRSDT